MILRNFTRSLLKLNRVNAKVKPLDSAVCIDIECTCDTPVQIHPMELIEIACLKVDLTKPTTKSPSNQSNDCDNYDDHSIFHSYVKPVINPELTLFCQDLTGITQQMVDSSETVGPVLGRMIDWLREQNLIDENNEKKEEFAFASCGNFDLSLLSPLIKAHKFSDNLELPIYFKEWINVKKTFVNHKREWPKGLYHMLDMLDVEPIGRLHSAKDDCKNLAKVVESLHSEGCKFYVTRQVQ